MKESSELTVTIKLKSFEFENLCRIINKAEEADKKKEDTIKLELGEKEFVTSICKRLVFSGKRKAEKLESIGNEIRNSIEYAKSI